MAQFQRVLERFMPQDMPGSEEGADGDADGAAADGGGAAAEGGGEGGGGAACGSDADSDEEEGGEGGSKLSKKQRKLLSRLKIAELKQKCARPDVVEVWDVTAQDPETLVSIKVRLVLARGPRRACCRAV
jgi:splicing factor 3B subunit 2